MAKRLPVNFDAEAYAAAYPDVALSGLDPRDHFRRFGRLLKRSPSGEPGINLLSAAPPLRRDPIIDRPDDLGDLTREGAPPPPRTSDPTRLLDLEFFAEGPFEAPEDRDGMVGPLAAYARLLRFNPPATIPNKLPGDLRPSPLLRKGRTRIENAWFAQRSRLRLILAGSDNAPAEEHNWVLRAYQARPGSPGKLQEAGIGARMPALGPLIHDIELVHPLMPLILELSDRDGVTRAITLVPFPSLLPGGIHGAELRALQNRPKPIDAFWHLSATLLREHLAEDAEPSIKGIWMQREVSERYPAPELEQWLAVVFEPLLESRGASSKSDDLRLLLPPDAYPTISALVSRRIGVGGTKPVNAPFLIVDPETLKPRWSVALPAHHAAAGPVPHLLRNASAPEERGPAVPVHVAVVQRAIPNDEDLLATTGALSWEDPPAQLAELSVLIEMSDPARTYALIQTLSYMFGNGLELFVRVGHLGDELRELFQGVPRARWTECDAEADIRDLARAASHDHLLTISDCVALEDPQILSGLCQLLHEDAVVGSASCVLVGEHVVKRNVVLRPAFGGLFPAHVSFLSSPRLSFAEPDVLQALDGLTYPVVANVCWLTAWNRRALANLASSTAPASDGAADIRLGLDLLAAGYTNLCTARIKARLRLPYARRDAIDPVGSAYLQPKRWEDILGRVTVLRELV